jgi:hypothetical protein
MKKKHEREDDFDVHDFSPTSGDVLLELKKNYPDNLNPKERVFIWRMIVTDRKIKKVWPEKNTSECSHKDVLWAIDAKRRLITLCEECGDFAFGQECENG